MDPITAFAFVATIPLTHKIAGIMIAASWLGFWQVWLDDCRKDEEGRP